MKIPLTMVSSQEKLTLTRIASTSTDLQMQSPSSNDVKLPDAGMLSQSIDASSRNKGQNLPSVYKSASFDIKRLISMP